MNKLISTDDPKKTTNDIAALCKKCPDDVSLATLLLALPNFNHTITFPSEQVTYPVLSIAAGNAQLSVVKALLSGGANPFQTDSQGWWPVNHCMDCDSYGTPSKIHPGKEGIVRLLVSAMNAHTDYAANKDFVDSYAALLPTHS